MHRPSLRNVQGIVAEIRAGLRVLEDRRSKARWTADLLLHRAPRRLQGPRRSTRRIVRLHDGCRLRYRLNRGDLQSIREVWLNDTYRLPAGLGSMETLVDLGANIGLTSVYLTRHYDLRRIVAVEPVPSNAQLVRENLFLNDIQGHVIEAVVGSAPGVAYFQDSPDSNVGHLASVGRQVTALSIGTVLGRVGSGEIDILKVDIEGAEEALFSGDTSWLTRVRVLMIEFHPSLVDFSRLVHVIETEGFSHIPAGTLHPHSVTVFVRI